MRRVVVAVIALLAANMILPASTEAAFPGSNGLIVFTRDDQVFAIESDGSDETQLTDAGVNKSPAWSGDGNRIAWACDHDICLSDADGSNREVLLASANHEQQPEWSPDGKWIVFSRQDPMPDFISYSEPRIYKVEVSDPGNVVQLTDFVAGDPEWSPDEEEIVFVRGDIYGGEGIWSIRPDGSGLRKIYTRFYQNATPDWSPDGERIIFLAKKRNAWRVVMITRSGHLIRESEPTHCCGLGVAWSPDGRRIVYVRASRRRLVVARPRGADRTAIAEEARSPDWQPR